MSTFTGSPRLFAQLGPTLKPIYTVATFRIRQTAEHAAFKLGARPLRTRDRSSAGAARRSRRGRLGAKHRSGDRSTASFCTQHNCPVP